MAAVATEEPEVDLEEVRNRVGKFKVECPALYEAAVTKGLEKVWEMQEVEKQKLDRDAESNQIEYRGRRPRPFNFTYAANLITANPYHGAAVYAKARALVGFGFVKEPLTDEEKDQLVGELQHPLARFMPDVVLADAQKFLDARQSKVARILDPLCEGAFQSVLGAVAIDFVNLANGALEVVRDENEEITGLHYLPAKQLWVVVESRPVLGDDDQPMKDSEGKVMFERSVHYQVDDTPLSGLSGHVTAGAGGRTLSPADRKGEGFSTRRFAAFGDREAFAKHKGKDKTEVSEVIHFFIPSAKSKHYGYAEWLSAVPHIRASQCMLQQQFAWFYHRAVPEFALFIIGAKLDDETWDKIESTLLSHSGPDGAYRTLLSNIEDEKVRVQIERLGIDESRNVGNTELDDIATRGIVSAHRVPEGLANVQTRGKPGAANERANDVMTFQLLNIGPLQHELETILGCTLGAPTEDGGVPDLEPGDFRLRKITDEIDLTLFSDVGRAKQPLTEAIAEGRDMNEGTLP